MAELKVGLAPNRTGYFDPITKTYMTLENRVAKVFYDENDMPATVKRLEKIVHALFASVPALVLFEGNVPQECIDAWKAKYMKPFNTLTTRNIVENGKVIGSVPIADPVRNNMDYVGKPVEPNRAFDRPEKVNAASADVVTASTEQAEIIDESELKMASMSSEQGELLAPETTGEKTKGKTKAKSDK